MPATCTRRLQYARLGYRIVQHCPCIMILGLPAVQAKGSGQSALELRTLWLCQKQGRSTPGEEVLR